MNVKNKFSYFNTRRVLAMLQVQGDTTKEINLNYSDTAQKAAWQQNLINPLKMYEEGILFFTDLKFMCNGQYT